MKMKINEFQAVAEWQWDLDEAADDTCGICRTKFEGCCARCKYPGDECPIIAGACSHIFHMHCIMNWIRSESSQGRCPMCRQQFKEKSANARKSVGGSAPDQDTSNA